jgi:uncharacterized membrane protein
MVPMANDLRALTALFVASGCLHLVRPQSYEKMVPAQLPAPRGLIYASGLAELACAAGLICSPTRKAAGWASAALLVGIFPANVQMAITERSRARRGSGRRARQVATLARLPVQIPLIRTALKATGRL